VNEYRIVVNIDEDAKVNMEAHGFTGGKCLEEMEKLLEEISVVMEVEKKAEFDQQVINRGYVTVKKGVNR